MKALWITGILFAFVMLVVPAMAITITPLYAGRNILVGEVTINDQSHTITYDTWDEWEMTETHVAIADSWKEIPQIHGNPIPGQFEYSTVHNPPVTTFTYQIDPTWWDDAEKFDIAAHAEVVHTIRKSMDVVSSTSTKVIEVNRKPVPEPQNAVAANEPFNYPHCSNTPSDDSKSWWDDGIGDLAYEIFTTPPPAADWIWNTPDPESPIEGDVVKFQEKFIIPGDPRKGFLFITADSGYEVVLNGANIDPEHKRAQLGPGFPDTLKEDVGAGPQVGEWGVASQVWQSVESYPIAELLVNGENTLDITAANEYMWDEVGSYQGPDFSLLSDGKTILPDIDPVTDSSGNSICGNPAGLIYRANIRYTAVDRQETAWAFGDAFPGRNWATYFTYDDGN